MSKTFKFARKYYDSHNIYKKSQVTIQPGITILIGCNGSGKSTLQHIMRSQLKSENIQFVSYDNETDGGHYARQNQMDFGDPLLSLHMVMSSEGENISINLANFASKVGRYITTGKADYDSLAAAFATIFDKTPNYQETNERWIFIDAADSGYSIDNILELKHLFPVIIEHCKDKALVPYIVVSTNSYEMCVGMPCLSVVDCKYVNIDSYANYKNFILDTRKYKDAQIDKYSGSAKNSD